MLALLATLLALPARAQVAAESALPSCVAAEKGYYLAKVEDAAKNLALFVEPKRMREVCAAGAVVSNGTFFAPGTPLGDVIVDGQAVHSPQGGDRRFKKGERWVDLGRRWGVGVLSASGMLAVVDGDSALGSMRTYLGGGGLLLQGGVDATDQDQAVARQWGPSFPDDGILGDTRGRLALGVKPEVGRQVLLVLSTTNEAHADVHALARVMKALGATDAVFYDGGGAHGFAAGGRCLILPTNAGEDLNPTHLVIKACR